ncbi:MAG: YihY/virulence factor BrkB family protein [Brevibacterium yomogidense]|uniref:YihY/virulence factor BrkB family protein n=1 Tax=Brevibacterium sp. Mu109 TaxID=1255669 RepID=UPI000C4ED14D|nr:YihY/virulence factor BrkB family protein [Brevibacterium sp. Mu109]SMX83101.1 membrane protein [Brevibacterium sp. Mu109]
MSYSPRDRRSLAAAAAGDAEAPTAAIPATAAPAAGAPTGAAPADAAATGTAPTAVIPTTAVLPTTAEPTPGTSTAATAPVAGAGLPPSTVSGPPRSSWFHILRTAFREFIADESIDLAAGLTFRGLLSVFPALVALVSILSLLGQGGSVITSVLDEAEKAAPTDTLSTVRPFLESVLDTPAPGWGLIVGLAIALWSASGYVKAFSRAMNTVVGVPEGRGFFVFNLVMYLLTALILILGALVLLVFVISGPIAEAVGGLLGMGDIALMVWNVARWFVLTFVVVLLVALLFHATPNVKGLRFRWLSVGALVAILVSILATLGFLFYISQFGTYNATYGALTGVIILMLWVFIMNSTLLFGAQLDSEIERMRQLREGLPAEEELQLPVRGTKASDRQARKYADDVQRGRAIRLSAAASRGETVRASSGEDRSGRGESRLRRRFRPTYERRTGRH